MIIHEKYMQRCIDLARNGAGMVSPNPLVGAVIVHKNKIIGEGWHQKAGTPHAEVHAINSVIDKSLLPESTIYVSLEPCAHFGKTPPCADLIVANNIKRVVVGTTDPNPAVAGKGIKRIQENGTEVIVGVLEETCHDLNKIFFTFQEKKRPFITLKWAQTKDGFIDKIRAESDIGSFPISGFSSKVFVHQLRATHAAILVGSNTARTDNPGLTTRWYGGNNPVRLVLDRKNTLPKTLQLFTDEEKTYHFIGEKAQEIVPTKSVKIPEKDFLKNVIDFCYQQGIQSILVEGGATILEAFISKKLWDEAYRIVATKTIGIGLAAPKLEAPIKKSLFLVQDEIQLFSNP